MSNLEVCQLSAVLLCTQQGIMALPLLVAVNSLTFAVLTLQAVILVLEGVQLTLCTVLVHHSSF